MRPYFYLPWLINKFKFYFKILNLLYINIHDLEKKKGRLLQTLQYIYIYTHGDYICSVPILKKRGKKKNVD